MIATTTATPGRNAAFTLLEVMLAVFILTLVMLSLFMLLSQSTRTFQRVTVRSDILYNARGAMDTLSRDFRNIYYIDESSYNITARNMADRLRNRATDITYQSLRGSESDNRYKDREARRSGLLDHRNTDEDDEEFLLPPEIDLTFVGSDAQRIDQVSFTTYQPNPPQGFYMPWGLRRVHYLVQGGNLIRTEEDVFKENLGPNGEIVAKPNPKPERLATNVAEFNIEYGFWYDGEWRLADDWQSSQSQRRFTKPEGDHEDWGLTVEQYQEFMGRIPPDDLPAFVRISLSFSPAPNRKGGGLTHFRKTFRLYPSQETFFPIENLLSTYDQLGDSSRRQDDPTGRRQ